mgnify:FL=1
MIGDWDPGFVGRAKAVQRGAAGIHRQSPLFLPFRNDLHGG